MDTNLRAPEIVDRGRVPQLSSSRSTVIVLLADVNIQGHVEILIKRMQAEPCIGFWRDLELSCVSFADLGLSPQDSDAVVWHRCQERRAFLLTNNRNDDGPDSLESTICTYQYKDPAWRNGYMPDNFLTPSDHFGQGQVT